MGWTRAHGFSKHQENTKDAGKPRFYALDYAAVLEKVQEAQFPPCVHLDESVQESEEIMSDACCSAQVTFSVHVCGAAVLGLGPRVGPPTKRASSACRAGRQKSQRAALRCLMRLTHPASKRTRSDTHEHLNPSKLALAPDELLTLLHASPSRRRCINTPNVPGRQGEVRLLSFKILFH